MGGSCISSSAASNIEKSPAGVGPPAGEKNNIPNRDRLGIIPFLRIKSSDYLLFTFSASFQASLKQVPLHWFTGFFTGKPHI
jgi:hypothetical protein